MPRIHTHPGEVLREEFMAPLGLSANALARDLHVPPNRITAIIATDHRRAVTPDTALRLARTVVEHGERIADEVRPRAA